MFIFNIVVTLNQNKILFNVFYFLFVGGMQSGQQQRYYNNRNPNFNPNYRGNFYVYYMPFK